MQVSGLVFEMIEALSLQPVEPQDQEGEAVLFRRRKSDQTRLPEYAASAHQISDFVRMVDGEGYAAAFIDYGSQRFELSNARLHPDGIVTGTFMLKTRDIGASGWDILL